jgi:hypothetical protein
MGSNNSKTSAAHKNMKKTNSCIVKSVQKKENNIHQLTQIQNTFLSYGEDNTNVQKLMVVTEKAKTQIEREDKPFTKNDWIAVLVAIGEIELKDMERVEKSYTVPEMISMIRENIYNPKRYIASMQNTQNTQNDILELEDKPEKPPKPVKPLALEDKPEKPLKPVKPLALEDKPEKPLKPVKPLALEDKPQTQLVVKKNNELVLVQPQPQQKKKSFLSIKF